MQTTNTPLISVVITCYNGEKYLNRCFSSLDSQTYQNLQVIFINDGSTDNSLNLISEYCALHPNYKVIDTPNVGVGSAKNMGINQADGDYLTFCDCDDVLEPNHIEYLLTLIQKHGAQMSVSRLTFIKSKKIKKFPTCKKYKSKEKVFDRVSAMQQFFSQRLFEYTLPNKMFDMKVVKESGARLVNGHRYGEESPFVYQFLKFTDKVVYGSAPTYRYIQWKSSLMHVSFNHTKLQVYDNVNAFFEDCQKNYPQVVPYVRSFRSGYSAGILYFIFKSDYREKQTLEMVISLLKEDCKTLKKCKRTALYRRLLIPLIPPVAKLVFRKHLRKKTN